MIQTDQRVDASRQTMCVRMSAVAKSGEINKNIILGDR